MNYVKGVSLDRKEGVCLKRNQGVSLDRNEGVNYDRKQGVSLSGISSKEKGILLIFIEPGEPTQNAYIERFNGTFRRDVLNAYVFKSIKEVDEITSKWIIDYNYNIPHQSLKNKTPMEYVFVE